MKEIFDMWFRLCVISDGSSHLDAEYVKAEFMHYADMATMDKAETRQFWLWMRLNGAPLHKGRVYYIRLLG